MSYRPRYQAYSAVCQVQFFLTPGLSHQSPTLCLVPHKLNPKLLILIVVTWTTFKLTPRYHYTERLFLLCFVLLFETVRSLSCYHSREGWNGPSFYLFAIGCCSVASRSEQRTLGKVWAHPHPLEIFHSITICYESIICWALQRRPKWSHLERE